MQCTRLPRLHHYSAQMVAMTTGLMRSNTRGHYLCHCVSVVNRLGPVEICAVHLCRTSLHFLVVCYKGCLHLAYTHSTHLVHMEYTSGTHGVHTWHIWSMYFWYAQNTHLVHMEYTFGTHRTHTVHICSTHTQNTLGTRIIHKWCTYDSKRIQK